MFLGLNLAYFPLKKCIYFPEDLVTLQTAQLLRSLCLQNRRVKLPGQGGDGEHCCTITALKAFPSPWHAPSQAAPACLQTLNPAEGFYSVRLNLTRKSQSSIGAISIRMFTWDTKILIPPIRSPPIILNTKATTGRFVPC